MSVLGNIIWLICGGFFTGLGYIIGGLALCLTIVGIPFGLQSIKLGAATMTPFGMEIVPAEDGGGALRPLFNIIWLVLFGSRVADRGGAPGLGRGAGNHHHRASVCPPTSEIAPPGAIPLWAGTPLAVTVCPPDCGKGQKQPVVEPAEHLICAQDPPHPAGDGTLVGRCPQGRHSVLFGRGETPFHSDPAHTQQIERRGKSDWRYISMKALVVYDSFFGNTEQIAQAIGNALGSPEDVEILRVGDVKPEQFTGLELLIVGSPTRGFKPTPAISNLLKSIPGNGLKGVKVAAFDTRFTVEEIKSSVFILPLLVNIFGYAAKPISDRLQKKGGELIIPPEGFFVDGTEGPLKEGELERAADWTEQIIAAP